MRQDTRSTARDRSGKRRRKCRGVEKTRLKVVFYQFSCYIYLMDIIVEFNDAAFDHSIEKEDILNALNTKIRDISISEFPEKNLVIGFDCAGNPLEILYNPLDNDIVYVFHAMKLREKTRKMAGL